MDKELRARIHQLKFWLAIWLVVAVLYGVMLAATLVLNGVFSPLFFAMTAATAGAAVLDVIWIRKAQRQLRAIES